MLHLARAFLWLRWRTGINSLRGSGRRDTLESFSRAFAIILPIILMVLFVPALIGATALMFFGGYRMGQSEDAAAVVSTLARVALAIVTAAVVVAPMIRSVRREETNLARFLLLPIPRPLLHLLDWAASITDPWLALVVPLPVALPAGLLVAGRPGLAVVTFLAGLALLVSLVGLTSCASHFLNLLYRDRRRGEAISLIVFMLFSFAMFVPLLLSNRLEDSGRKRVRERSAATSEQGSKERRSDGEAQPESGGDEGNRKERLKERGMRVRIPRLAGVAPSELYARVLTPGDGSGTARALSLAGLGGFAAGFYGLSWLLYRRLLDAPAGGTSRRVRGAFRASVTKFPGLGPAASAVASTQIRMVLRTLQGKMAIYFTPISFLVTLFVLSQINRGGFIWVGRFGGPFMVVIGSWMSLLALQKISLNQLASDGAGLTLQFLTPVSDRDLVTGKAAGLGILSAVPILAYMTIAAVVAEKSSPLLWVAALLVGLSSYLLFAPVAALLSALFPKAADLGRIGSAGHPSGAASFVGFFVTSFVYVPPALLAALGLFVLRSDAVTLALEALWAVVAFACWTLLAGAAAQTVGSRRENLAMVAQGR